MPYPATPTFWVDPTDRAATWLRRYASSSAQGSECPAGGYHQALVAWGERQVLRRARHVACRARGPAHTDPRWPAKCDGCGYAFTEQDAYHLFWQVIYQRAGTEQRWPQRDLPPGAMFDAWWYPRKGPDGISLQVILPNGRQWGVDMQASNCTMPEDRNHYCWVRHGDPRTEPVTVDKNGATCAAGAGSIQAGDYHGFLQAGVLTAG